MMKKEINYKNLIEQAVAARDNAKAKFSNFKVGCALLTDNDEIILGCNIESAAYPSTLCAERVAIYSALSKGYENFKAIAVVSDCAAKPCGPCRQIIYEYLGDIPIFLSNPKIDKIDKVTIEELLPYPFG